MGKPLNLNPHFLYNFYYPKHVNFMWNSQFYHLCKAIYDFSVSFRLLSIYIYQLRLIVSLGLNLFSIFLKSNSKNFYSLQVTYLTPLTSILSIWSYHFLNRNRGSLTQWSHFHPSPMEKQNKRKQIATTKPNLTCNINRFLWCKYS